MRTIIRLRDELLKRAKQRAAAENRSLASLIEEAVVLILARPVKKHHERVRLPLSRSSGGLNPGVNLNRSKDIEGFLEDA